MARKNNKKRQAPRRADRRPSATNLWVPIAVPSATGNTELVIGEGTLRNGLIVLKLKDTLASVAVQRMFERGSVLGLQFVMLQADETNEAQQEKLIQEAKDREDLKLLNEEEDNIENREADDIVEEDEVLAQAQEIVDGVDLEVIDEEVPTDDDVSVGLAENGYDVPVYLGEAGTEDRPQVGWARVKEDGTADVIWTGEPPFDQGALIHTSFSESDISVYSAPEEPSTETEDENNNEETN